jgi:hypothetical protein
MTEIDRYISELTSRLKVGARTRTRILAEVSDHLDDAIAYRMQTTERLEQAASEALDAFGSPLALASQFNAEAGARAMRRAPIVAFAGGLAVVTGFVVAGATQPQSATPTNATIATQISFFAAVLAFQIAVVAGMCAAARALARWRTSARRGADRQFVRQCTVISTGALGVAAVGWASTMSLALNRLVDPNRATLAIGGVIMVCAAGTAIAAAHRLQVNPSDDADDRPDDTSRFLGVGERVIEFVRAHPVASCGGAAALSVWPAMSHAETTLAGALPWGMAQAATVVMGFILLGPALGLRRPNRARTSR